MSEEAGPAKWQPSADRAKALAILAQDPEELAQQRKRLRRNGIVLITILDLLIIAVGFAGSGDLRRLATPEGAAAAWADAAGSGDCDRYADLETADRHDAELAGAKPKPGQSRKNAYCEAVSTGWSDYGTVTSDVTSENPARNQALVHLSVNKAGGTAVTGFLLLRHTGGHWRVARPGGSCPDPAYAPAQALCPAATFAAEP